MESIDRNQVQQRVGVVFDTAAGAQMQHKGISKYVKALREAVGLGGPQKSETQEFLRDFGKGI